MRSKIYNTRSFLNTDKTLSAYMITSLEYYKDNSYNNIMGNVKISDCNRIIELDFSAFGSTHEKLIKDANISLKKLNKIIDIVEKYRDKYIETLDYIKSEGFNKQKALAKSK